MPAMPELEHQDSPEQVAVVGCRVGPMTIQQFLHRAGAEVSTCPGACREQGLTGQLLESRVIPKPDARGHAKTVLALRENLRRQDLPEGAFEEIALLEPSNFPPCRHRAGELDEVEVEHRESHSYSCQLGRPRDLQEVVVPDRELEVEIEKLVELRRRLDPVVG